MGASGQTDQQVERSRARTALRLRTARPALRQEAEVVVIALMLGCPGGLVTYLLLASLTSNGFGYLDWSRSPRADGAGSGADTGARWPPREGTPASPGFRLGCPNNLAVLVRSEACMAVPTIAERARTTAASAAVADLIIYTRRPGGPSSVTVGPTSTSPQNPIRCATLRPGARAPGLRASRGTRGLRPRPWTTRRRVRRAALPGPARAGVAGGQRARRNDGPAVISGTGDSPD